MALDPANVVVTFLGVPLHGFADGSYVKAARTENAFKLYIGADGEGARMRNRNRSGTIELTLGQYSQSNDVLSAAARLDEAGAGGQGALLVKDLSGTTLITAPIAWVQKIADSEHGDDVSSRKWVFETNELIMFVGGSI